jgi:hypothetical protein
MRQAVRRQGRRRTPTPVVSPCFRRPRSLLLSRLAPRSYSSMTQVAQRKQRQRKQRQRLQRPLHYALPLCRAVDSSGSRLGRAGGPSWAGRLRLPAPGRPVPSGKLPRTERAKAPDHEQEAHKAVYRGAILQQQVHLRGDDRWVACTWLAGEQRPAGEQRDEERHAQRGGRAEQSHSHFRCRMQCYRSLAQQQGLPSLIEAGAAGLRRQAGHRSRQQVVADQGSSHMAGSSHW